MEGQYFDGTPRNFAKIEGHLRKKIGRYFFLRQELFQSLCNHVGEGIYYLSPPLLIFLQFLRFNKHIIVEMEGDGKNLVCFDLSSIQKHVE